MKLWKKAVLIVLALLVLAVAGLAIWQRENILAAYTAFTGDPDKIAGDLESVRNDFQQSMQEKTEEEIIVKPPSLQQSEDILNGKVSAEEVKESLGIHQVLKPSAAPTPSPLPEPSQTAAPEPTPPQTVTPEPTPAPTPVQSTPPPTQSPKPSAQELINQCMAELTACQVDLMAQLGEMKTEALKDWNSRTPEGRTKDKMLEFGMMWLEECYDVEVEIDAQVVEILERYEAQLAEIGADTTVINTMWNYYEQEKAAQKAYYLNKYLK